MAIDLDRLEPRFRILRHNAGASRRELGALRKRFPATPDEYFFLCKQMTEIELNFVDRYLRIWAPARVLELDEGYGISKALPGAVPIGDDGGGTALIYFTGADGFGLYAVDFGATFEDETKFLARSLEELLTTGRGLDRLFGRFEVPPAEY